jgi:Histidine kinase-, DNA gyrase B-, and HSP90-like ATPase/Response regulator receiver domain/His Kinase A (phospho-acceptor) domain
VGQLTGGVAHDFNNLLTVVSGNLELIEHAADNGRVRQFAAAARRAADRGATLTAQLLAFSRRQKLNPKLVSANELISEFQGLIRQAVGGGCELRLRTDEQLWLCHIDPPLLETALLNLALNGRDAMPDGGVLEIETRNVVLDEGAVAGCVPGPYVRLSVADNGCGMPPEVRDRVFEPFFTTKEVGKGTGLGLSMVYGFVRQSDGHVTIESTPGAGTTVALYLPRAEQTAEAEVETIQTQAVPGGHERILVVEDHEDLLEATSAMLTTFGYRVLCARNGAEAIHILESGQEIELLFSDVVMPNGMNGVELAREPDSVTKTSKFCSPRATRGMCWNDIERWTSFRSSTNLSACQTWRGVCGQSCRRRKILVATFVSCGNAPTRCKVPQPTSRSGCGAIEPASESPRVVKMSSGTPPPNKNYGTRINPRAYALPKTFSQPSR